MPSGDLDERLDRLTTIVEEATRSTKEGIRYFVEPAPGVLQRALSKRHHIIFGRRGSGKSSLLRKVESDASRERRPVVYVDMEQFKAHSYPDVLISVLIRSLDGLTIWLGSTAIILATRKSFWSKLTDALPTRGALNKRRAAQLTARINAVKLELASLLHEADTAKRSIRSENKDQMSLELAGSMSVGVPGIQTNARGEARHSSKGSTTTVVQSQYTSKKIEYLQRAVLSFKDLLTEIAVFSGGPGYIILDDFYHIRSVDQADVIDYFHKICKDTNLWLKIGTLKHRTRHYLPGDPPRGIKVSDDADDIDLDVTLEKYQTTKRFLKRILSQFVEEVGARIDDVLTEGAVDRLVLASGGVARDFLTIFRRSISIARERTARGGTKGGDKIITEDINSAVGAHDSSKREEFSLDTKLDEQNPLLDLFGRISRFCLDDAKANCFLVEKDYRGIERTVINELVDLKFLHRVSTRVTVRHRVNRIYEAYMLDLSQYVGERARKNFVIMHFWETASDDLLRKAGLILLENPAQ
jgi:hypothetical protein